MNKLLALLPRKWLAPLAFLAAAGLSLLAALWAAIVVENRSAAAVTSRLLGEGFAWVKVEADGLQIQLAGTAPNEAARFRAVNIAGSVIDAARVRDFMEVPPRRSLAPPRFSVEILRSDEGVQLIGLLPDMSADKTPGPNLAEAAAALAPGLQVTDMLETAAAPAPEGWQPALAFSLEALKLLPRAKISVAAGRVAITAVSGSAAEKRALEGRLRDLAPQGVTLSLDISAPRPVLTPFTLRFVKDAGGARFDACAADSEAARQRILSAAIAAGIKGAPSCTLALGVPSPRWGEAAAVAIDALARLSAGSVTFSDADITLLAAPEVPPEDFDQVVGDLQAALPPAFSLKATLEPRPEAEAASGPIEFTASLSPEGRAALRGKVSDALQQEAVRAYADAAFGAPNVNSGVRLDDSLPEGWPLRVLAGLEALAELVEGQLRVTPDLVEISGVSGSKGAQARITQILSDKLGQGQTFKVAVTYDEARDPEAAVPTPEECFQDVQTALLRGKITFAAGSAEIEASAGGTLDALAEVLTRCPDLALEVGAHSDSQGSEGSNKALSQARADAVVLALQGRQAPVGLLRAVGYGEERPIADNETEAGREANRRIEFTRLGAPGAAPAAAAASGPKGRFARDDRAFPEAPETAAPDGGTAAAPDLAGLRPKANPRSSSP